MFSIAICDDDEHLCFDIENILLNYSNKVSKKIDTEVFFSGEELCEALHNEKYFDLIFLDIEMRLLSGVEVGLKIRNEMKNESVQIVYISSHNQYALELFKIRPMDFLIKPLEEISIITSLEDSIKYSKKYVKTFQYNIRHEIHKVLVDNILYFSSKDREVRIHFLNDCETFYGSLESVHKELKHNDFIRLHRSFLVNYNKIKVFMKDKVTLINDEVVPISRVRQKKVKEIRALIENK